MAFKMMELKVEKFILSESISLIERLYEEFEEGIDFKDLNFGHYKDGTTNYELVIRVKMDFLSDETEQKAFDIVGEFKDIHNNILDMSSHWLPHTQKDARVRKAITLASKCTIKIGKLDWFKDCWMKNENENNFPPNGDFLKGFFHLLFNRLTNVEMFSQQDVNRIFSDNSIKNLIEDSVNEIYKLCETNLNEFFHFNFFERFEHMLCNDLLYLVYFSDDGNGYYNFLSPFSLRYDANGSKTADEACRQFCKEMRQTYEKN